MHHTLSLWHVIILAIIALVLFGGARRGWFGPFDGDA